MNSPNRPAIYLNQFLPILPKNKLEQKKLIEWTAQCHLQAEKLNPKSTLDEAGLSLMKKLFDRYAVKQNQISQRYFECDDVFKESFTQSEIYIVNEEVQSGADILQRTQFFAERAFAVFQQIYTQSKKPDHILHVTCTGYISPSAPQRMVVDENWKHSTAVTHAYHMGCYAALPAIRLAQGLVNEDVKHVDIVHTEMCGLHMNPLAQTPEQTIVQTLFADGHIKYTASANKTADQKNLKLVAIHEKIIADSTQDMSWVPAPWGMQMNLSREVPVKIKNELKPFFSELLKKADLDYATAMKSIFAIHPGGPKIIDAVQDVLELKDEQTMQSKKVLFERGNMSSATLPHVWNEILRQSPAAGTRIISFAFGPGLTLFGSVFEVC
ncbi:MAG: naringenin-chalcone synthase [Bdellovibrionaceae bacterium]|nr:naringenin-chalcone synthase [Bdellovibrio sp.]